MATGGCSWIFVKPLPPDYRSGDAVDCTVDPTAPIVDTLLVATHIAGIVYLSSKSNDQNKDQVNSLVTSELIGAITWGSSAIYGYRRISACSDARDEDTGSFLTTWACGIALRTDPACRTVAGCATADRLRPEHRSCA